MYEHLRGNILNGQGNVNIGQILGSIKKILLIFQV